jgi:hypothetical protein
LATPPRSSTFTRSKPSPRPASVSVSAAKNGAKLPVRASVAPVAAPRNGNGRVVPPAKSIAKPEAKILFQKYFRSVGPRTYAAQVKELGNGNHLLVLTEGKRDAESGEVKKTRLLVFGEDFSAFFKLLHETATFIRANPLSEEIRQRRGRFWAKKNKESRAAGRSSDE